jgi:hypothetical protein
MGEGALEILGKYIFWMSNIYDNVCSYAAMKKAVCIEGKKKQSYKKRYVTPVRHL